MGSHASYTEAHILASARSSHREPEGTADSPWLQRSVSHRWKKPGTGRRRPRNFEVFQNSSGWKKLLLSRQSAHAGPDAIGPRPEHATPTPPCPQLRGLREPFSVGGHAGLILEYTTKDGLSQKSIWTHSSGWSSQSGAGNRWNSTPSLLSIDRLQGYSIGKESNADAILVKLSPLFWDSQQRRSVRIAIISISISPEAFTQRGLHQFGD